MKNEYTPYESVDKEKLKNEIEEIKKHLKPNKEDLKHLKKMILWTRMSFYSGFLLIALMIFLRYATDIEISSFIFWSISILGAIVIGFANFSKWANVAHPILHGAYDRIENVPKKYTKDGFAKGYRRYIDWLDWIKPEAWSYEHNIMHHYHLGEDYDPDNVEINLQWLHKKKIPMFFKYAIVYTFAAFWKIAYYAPNTQRILHNKNKNPDEIRAQKYEFSPFTKREKELWKEYILPYGIFQFIILPSLFLPFGIDAFFDAFILMVIAEIYANLHSFLVIVPNHSAEDIYQFSSPHKSQGEYYLRQIMGSVNYNTGNDFIDFLQGFLNYQIEHHLFPNMPNSYYQKMQPIVKEICKNHNIEYRQESVFKRIFMTIDLMVGKTKLLRVDGV